MKEQRENHRYMWDVMGDKEW